MSTKSKTITAYILLTAGILPSPALAEARDTFIRVRGIMVAPNEDSTGISPAFPTEEVSVNNSVMPEVDITHMVTDNVGLELIAATTKHSVSGKTGTTGGIGKLASAWVLPPTLTLHYHLAPESKVRPYVGAGVNWTLFWSENASNGLEATVGPTDVKLKSSFGWAAQAGLDIELNERMFLDLDIKYIDIDTKARLFFASAEGDSQNAILLAAIIGCMATFATTFMVSRLGRIGRKIDADHSATTIGNHDRFDTGWS